MAKLQQKRGHEFSVDTAELCKKTVLSALGSSLPANYRGYKRTVNKEWNLYVQDNYAFITLLLQ
jgi:hypothetical protein